MKNIRIGELLIMEGLLTQSQLDHAIEIQKSSATRKRLGEIIIENNMVSENDMLQALAKQFGLPVVVLAEQKISIQSVAKIPKQLALKYNIIAISETNGALDVVLSDPLDLYALEDVKMNVNMPINRLLAHKEEIAAAVKHWYSEIDTNKAATNANETVQGVEVVEIEDLSGTPDDTPVVALVNSILYKAHAAGASDVHIEPFDEKTVMRIRVDGQILEFLTISKALHNSILTRIKILSKMDIAEKRIPQDGHFRARQNDLELNVRVSVLPTIFGEKAVMRFLSMNTKLDFSDTFGMGDSDYQKVVKMLQRPHGIIYITGPTGSGKTTTLYMILDRLSKLPVNISTVEDPVERNLNKINQTEINVQAGLTFAAGLRSLLRQDPDIIMVGETRDNETASIAVSAALTGHLVLSTLHTNDAVSAIARLVDMGIEPYMIANSLTGVVAQRLAKKICPNCKESYVPTDADLAVIQRRADVLYRGKGCSHCNNTGYKGRISIHEIFVIDAAVRNLITKGASADEINAYLFKNRLLTTLKDSMRKFVMEGTSTVDEMLKLISFA